MSAPKRTPQHTRKSLYLRPRETPDPPTSFRSKVLKYAGATRAFEKLTEKGLQGSNEGMFWRHLWGLASLKKAKKDKRSQWYALPGLPPHKLRRFPALVRGWADEIERLGKAMQSDPVYGRTSSILPVLLAEAIPNVTYQLPIREGEVLQGVGTANPAVSSELARRVLQRHATEFPKLAELPNLLRFYADYIEVLSKLTAHGASKLPAFLKAQMELGLVEFVRTVTEQPHWDEVATLLTAAYHANDCDVEVDPKALQMQHSRKK